GSFPLRLLHDTAEPVPRSCSRCAQTVSRHTASGVRTRYFSGLILSREQTVKKSMQAMVALLALAVISEQGLADNAEAFFAKAKHFPVRIDTTIERAFIEDEPGAFHGAGFVTDPERGWVLTNAHVVGHSPAKLTVTFSDGTKTRAEK